MAAPKVLTIDGPSAAGKGKISLLVADMLGWHLLPSGLIYRDLALRLHKEGGLPDKDDLKTMRVEDILKLVPSVLPEFRMIKNGSLSLRVFADAKDITHELMADDIGELAGKISTLPEVRDALKDKQLHFRRSPGLVAEGRDMGTVIFPDAFLKIFVNAKLQERANRRLKQLKSFGDTSATIEDVLHVMQTRDERDTNRTISPLKKPQDAIELDNTNVSAEQVAQQIVEIVRTGKLKI